MNKIWKKTNANSYELLVEGINKGTVELNSTSTKPKAWITCGDSCYILRSSGFFRNDFVLHDKTDNIIVAIKAEKWYGSSYTLIFKNEPYRLLIHNNPLSEWLILKDEKPLLSYTLGKSIETIAGCPLLFDCLIWYFFAPIAIENNDGYLLMLS